MLPARSVTWAVSALLPLLSVTLLVQLPLLCTMAVPTAVVPSKIVTVVPASATSTVPVMVWLAWLVGPPALVIATLELARIIIVDAALSFLGLGVQPPDPSWGRMLADGRVYISTAWWIVTFPGLAILLTVLSVNLLGDWLRDYFDPKLRTMR